MLRPSAPLWSVGFRPYFLLGSIIAPLLMARWILGYSGVWLMDTKLPALSWHAHEMLFGFTLAYVFGFLLTASANWAGKPPVRGGRLLFAVSCFLVARLLSTASAFVPLVFFSIFDLLAILMVLIFLYPYLALARKNLVIFGVLSALLVLNVLFHLEQHAVFSTGFDANRAALYLLLVILTIISGRVVPFFTSRRLGSSSRKEPKGLTVCIVVGVLGVAWADLADGPPVILGVLGGLAFVANCLRLGLWHQRKIWSEPMLWVLYIGYGWLALGYLLMGLSGFGFLSEFAALHAFTAGAISTMIIGMAARVTLGHTGRPIAASPVLILAFVAVIAAAALRVFGTLILPQIYLQVIAVSGVLWLFAFSLLAIKFGRIWLSPRI